MSTCIFLRILDTSEHRILEVIQHFTKGKIPFPLGSRGGDR